MACSREKNKFFPLEAKKGKENKHENNKKHQKKPKMRKRKNYKTLKYQKMSFSIISQIFLLFLVGVQTNFSFGQLDQKSAHPKNTIK